MFFIGRVLISIKSFYKNYNNQQHDNMNRIVDTYFLCIILLSFFIHIITSWIFQRCPYILQEMIYICDFRGGKL